MSKGFVIPAFQKRGYPFMAYSLAESIKYFSPEAKIALYHDYTISQLSAADKEVFDVLIPMDEKDKYTNGKFDPAKVKLSLYKFLPFDENIILDCDNVCISDIMPMFDDFSSEGGYYYSHVKQLYKYDGERVIEGMDWAYADDIYNRYDVKKTAILPCTNSSWQYVRKCDEAKTLFDKALHNLSNPIPLERLRYQWGAAQPDELYMNIAMMQMGITGQAKKQYTHLCNTIDRRPIHEMAKAMPLLSLLGGKNFSRPVYTEYYDRHLSKLLNEQGKSHKYKWYLIVKDKHAGIQQQQPIRKVASKLVKPAIIPISQTELIDHKKLIQSYPLPNNNTFKVTNWLNCSFIEFEGRKFFAYRMEAKPFCVYMKIGLCLLDDDYQPIPETNVLLQLHSELKGSVKGYHVEDPRLFIYDNNLYLSYTDGYQMAQAKINTETLKAEESFYIRKPNKNRTEKNWTFFEHDGKLLSIYDLPSMEIFEMNGGDWTEFSKSDKKIEWAYGEIRGGATPIKVGDKFICFFHSRTTILSGYQYHMGAIEFEAGPPFKITRITDRPIISGEEISPAIPRLSNKIYVVFPCGVIRESDGYAVSFGYNDYECRHVKVDDELLETLLTTI